MAAALQDVKGGMGVREAARLFSSIYHKHNNYNYINEVCSMQITEGRLFLNFFFNENSARMQGYTKSQS